MILITEESETLIALKGSGRICKEDYEQVVPALEQKLERSEMLDAIVDIEEVESIEPAALVEELRFSVRNRGNFRRVAIVGGGQLGGAAAMVAHPFFTGEVKHFDAGQVASARQWLKGL